MLSEDKIKKMIRLSDYENGQGRTDLRRTRFRKMDYVRLQVLKTFVAVIVVMMFVILLCLLYYATFLLENAMSLPYKTWIISISIVTVVLEIFSIIGTCRIASKEYEESKHRVKEYYVTLHELLEMYQEEERQEEASL